MRVRLIIALYLHFFLFLDSTFGFFYYLCSVNQILYYMSTDYLTFVVRYSFELRKWLLYRGDAVRLGRFDSLVSVLDFLDSLHPDIHRVSVQPICDTLEIITYYKYC